MKEDINKELNELSPFLSSLKKEEPFKTPKFYFDTLADRVMEQVKTETQAAPPQLVKQPSLTERLSNWLSALWQPRTAWAFATVCVFVVAGLFLIKNQKPARTDNVADVSTEEIQQYINENIQDFDEDLILNKGQIAAGTEGGNVMRAVEFSDSELEKYLNDNVKDSDLDSIANEL